MTGCRCHHLLAMFQDQFATRMPLLAWLQFDLKEDAPIGVPNRNFHIQNRTGNGTVKIFVIVGSTKSLLLLLPFSEHSAMLDETFCFHLEEISKIRAKRQFQGEADLLACVVRDGEDFVDATFNRAFERQADGMCLKITILHADFGICEICTRGVERELTGIDHVPGDTVDVELIETNEACIERVDALVTIGSDGAAFVGDHEGASLANGDDWWSDFNFDRHVVLLKRKKHLRCSCKDMRNYSG